MTSVQIDAIGAKSRDLKLPVFFQHHNDAEVCANRISAGKDFLHVLRARIGRDVEIFRSLTPDKITDAATREVSEVACCAQADRPNRAPWSPWEKKFWRSQQCALWRAALSLRPRGLSRTPESVIARDGSQR
jgi:hypothetical protein